MTEATGRELDVLVAVHLGWDWQDYQWLDGTTKRLLWHPTWRQPSGDDFDQLPGGRLVPWEMPAFSLDMTAAWEVVEYLRDKWTAATDCVSGLDNSFPRPFDDGAFFEVLRRNADRRWPWAFFYVTPEAVCRAALAALERADES